MNKLSVLAVAGLISTSAIAQDKATFKEYKAGYYQNTILKGISLDEKKEEAPKVRKRFKMDLTGKNYPTNPDEYNQAWHTKVISQGNTGTCWCFSTTSFYESEVKRLSGKEVDLSEMYTAYYEYIERAKYFVDHRGDMHLGEGSETNAVAKIMKKYGAVPHSAYTGMKKGQSVHTHAKMFDEIQAYFKTVKETNAWHKETVVATVKSILEHHMGAVPSQVTVDGKKMTPQDYLNNHLKMNMGNYVNLMSLMSLPYNTMQEYDVPDNWWNSRDYINVSLDDFMGAIKKALSSDFTISIGGDVSEPGFETSEQVAVVPSFDVASENIDENARQMRFSNGATTDDHAMHIVGYKEVDGKTWFLVKDSGSGSRNCGEKCKKFGYYFFHEDYIKLKMMTATVHADAVKQIMKNLKK